MKGIVHLVVEAVILQNSKENLYVEFQSQDKKQKFRTSTKKQPPIKWGDEGFLSMVFTKREDEQQEGTIATQDITVTIFSQVLLGKDTAIGSARLQFGKLINNQPLHTWTDLKINPQAVGVAHGYVWLKLTAAAKGEKGQRPTVGLAECKRVLELILQHRQAAPPSPLAKEGTELEISNISLGLDNNHITTTDDLEQKEKDKEQDNNKENTYRVVIWVNGVPTATLSPGSSDTTKVGLSYSTPTVINTSLLAQVWRGATTGTSRLICMGTIPLDGDTLQTNYAVPTEVELCTTSPHHHVHPTTLCCHLTLMGGKGKGFKLEEGEGTPTTIPTPPTPSNHSNDNEMKSLPVKEGAATSVASPTTAVGKGSTELDGIKQGATSTSPLPSSSSSTSSQPPTNGGPPAGTTVTTTTTTGGGGTTNSTTEQAIPKIPPLALHNLSTPSQTQPQDVNDTTATGNHNTLGSPGQHPTASGGGPNNNSNSTRTPQAPPPVIPPLALHNLPTTSLPTSSQQQQQQQQAAATTPSTITSTPVVVGTPSVSFSLPSSGSPRLENTETTTVETPRGEMLDTPRTRQRGKSWRNLWGRVAESLPLKVHIIRCENIEFETPVAIHVSLMGTTDFKKTPLKKGWPQWDHTTEIKVPVNINEAKVAICSQQLRFQVRDKEEQGYPNTNQCYQSIVDLMDLRHNLLTYMKLKLGAGALWISLLAADFGKEHSVEDEQLQLQKQREALQGMTTVIDSDDDSDDIDTTESLVDTENDFWNDKDDEQKAQQQQQQQPHTTSDTQKATHPEGGSMLQMERQLHFLQLESCEYRSKYTALMNKISEMEKRQQEADHARAAIQQQEYQTSQQSMLSGWVSVIEKQAVAMQQQVERLVADLNESSEHEHKQAHQINHLRATLETTHQASILKEQEVEQVQQQLDTITLICNQQEDELLSLKTTLDEQCVTSQDVADLMKTALEETIQSSQCMHKRLHGLQTELTELHSQLQQQDTVIANMQLAFKQVFDVNLSATAAHANLTAPTGTDIQKHQQTTATTTTDTIQTSPQDGRKMQQLEARVAMLEQLLKAKEQ